MVIKKMLEFLLLLPILSNSASVNLYTGLWLDWQITGSTIKFTLGLANTLYSADTYMSVGFKSADGGDDMKDLDIILFPLGETQSCYNTWTDSNEDPVFDGHANIQCFDRQLSGTTYMYSWSRLLNTGSSKDFNFEGKTTVKIGWAKGRILNGYFLEHRQSSSDRGFVDVYINGTEYASNHGKALSVVFAFLLLLVS